MTTPEASSTTDASTARLGKRDLGPYAGEECMPQRLIDLLRNEDDSNALAGVIPKLNQLLSRDPGIEVAYLCTTAAVQVHKLSDEGAHFCGYRNMQMLSLALPPRPAEGIDMTTKLSVLNLQELIEKAWSEGINPHGRAQTGGIMNTRKHVGSSEAEALFLSLNVPCTGSAFSGKDAWREVLDNIELYFSNGMNKSDSSEEVSHGSETSARVVQTSRPPIFLQRPRHSITVVGLERLKSGKRRLLVFDPAWRPPSALRGDVSSSGSLRWKESLALGRYRQSERYLRRFGAFEMVMIDQPS